MTEEQGNAIIARYAPDWRELLWQDDAVLYRVLYTILRGDKRDSRAS